MPSFIPAAAIGVADQDDPPPGGPPGDEQRIGCDVDSVGDQHRRDVRAAERRSDRSRIAVAERAHRVVEVRHGAGPEVERRVRLRRSRVGVPHRDGDTTLDERLDHLVRSVELGRERHRRHRAA